MYVTVNSFLDFHNKNNSCQSHIYSPYLCLQLNSVILDYVMPCDGLTCCSGCISLSPISVTRTGSRSTMSLTMIKMPALLTRKS